MERLREYYNKLRFEFDKLKPQMNLRWGIFLLCVFFYFLQLIIFQSHFLIAYIVGISILYEFASFCMPQDEEIPDLYEDFAEVDYTKPIEIDDDFKPFLRRLPEYDFWFRSMIFISFGIICTLFPFFDIPVCTPILFGYFLTVLFITLKNLYFHMQKFEYNPFFSNKRQFK